MEGVGGGDVSFLYGISMHGSQYSVYVYYNFEIILVDGL